MNFVFSREGTEARRGGFWLVVLMCGVAVWPFLKYEGLPQGTDAELHIYRLAELARMWEGGVIYPRWAANFYFGLGYPIFNYYAPLSYYLGLLFYQIPGVDVVLAVKIVFVLSIVGAGTGVYRFVRPHWGLKAGLIAAASYVYAPYILFTDPHARGVLPESVSLAVLPWALWAVDRLMRRPTKGQFVVTVVLIGAVVVAHNLMAVAFGAILFGYFVWVVLVRKFAIEAQRRWRGEKLTFLAFGLGVGLVAFFWLPMVGEQYAIEIGTVVGEGHYDFGAHFLDWRTLLGWNGRFDWRASEVGYAFNLGVGQWVLGAVGIGVVFWRGFFITEVQRSQRGKGGYELFFLVGAAVLIFLMVEQSAFVWEAVPVLPFFQFPWRFLGGTAMFLAVLGGIGGARLPAWGVAAVIVMLMGLGMPLTQVAPFEPLVEPSVRAVAVQETQGRWRGTTSTADFVPIGAVQDVSSEMIDGAVRPLIDGAVNGHVDWESFARRHEGAKVDVEVVSPVSFVYRVEVGEDGVLPLFLFDFPGWRVKNDHRGTEDTEVYGNYEVSAEGLIRVPVRAGESVVEVWFGGTAVRMWAWVISAVCAVLMVLRAAFIKSDLTLRREGAKGEHGENDVIGWVFAAVVIVTGVFVWVIDPAGWLHLESADYEAVVAENRMFAVYDERIALIGYDAPSTIERGEDVDVTLYWQAMRPLDENVQVFVHLRPWRDGLSFADVAQSSKVNPGDFPTEAWPVDKYVRDGHVFRVPDWIEAGTYQIVAGLWEQYEVGSPMLGVDGADWVVVGEYEIENNQSSTHQ